MGRPLLLLDTASLYFRAYYGVPESVTALDGTPADPDALAALTERWGLGSSLGRIVDALGW